MYHAMSLHFLIICTFLVTHSLGQILLGESGWVKRPTGHVVVCYGDFWLASYMLNLAQLYYDRPQMNIFFELLTAQETKLQRTARLWDAPEGDQDQISGEFVVL